LLLPDAGHRWLVAAGMGVFHGIYFGDFLRQAEMQAGWFLLGVGAAEIGVAVLIAFVLSRIRRAISRPDPVRVFAVLLLATGLGWFVMRIRG
jgi:hydrogenase/urease accessory protein HupE